MPSLLPNDRRGSSALLPPSLVQPHPQTQASRHWKDVEGSREAQTPEGGERARLGASKNVQRQYQPPTAKDVCRRSRFSDLSTVEKSGTAYARAFQDGLVFLIEADAGFSRGQCEF